MNKSKSKSKPKTGSMTATIYNTGSKSRKISQRKNETSKNKTSTHTTNRSNAAGKDSHNFKPYKDLLSPKTIEYSKIIEKYGDYMKENTLGNENTDRKYNKYSNIPENNFNRNYYNSNEYYTETDNTQVHPIKKNENLNPVNSTNNRNKKKSSEFDSVSEYEKNSSSVNINNHKERDRDRVDYKNYKENKDYKENKEIREIRENRDENNKQNKYDYSMNMINNENTKRDKARESYHNESENKVKELNHENEILKEENLTLKRLIEREKSKSYRLEDEVNRGNINIVSISEIEKLKEKISNVERENEELNHSKNQFIQNSQEKLTLFLKLNRKYIKKIKNIVLLFSKLESSNLQVLNTNKDSLMSELNSTIDKFNTTIHSPKLITSLLEISNENINFPTKQLFEEFELEDKNLKNEIGLVDVVKKLEEKIKKLSEENNSLQNKKIELKAHSNELNDKCEEINRLKRKFNDEKIGKEELEMSLKYVKQMNKDLETKMSILEDESNSLQKNVKSANEKLKEFDLTKNKKINLENEVKYKESIISYLETLLKSNNISYSSKFIQNERSNDKNYKKEKNTVKNNKLNYSYDSDYDFSNKKDYSKNVFNKSIRKEDISNYEKDINFNFTGRNFNSLKDSFNNSTSRNNVNVNDSNTKFNLDPEISDAEYRMRPSFLNASPKEKGFNIFADKNDKFDKNENNVNISKTSNLKNEIESLDGEIKHLQNKLKIMIDVNKK